MDEKVRALTGIIIELIIIQGIRIISTQIIFLFVKRTLFTDTVTSAIFMTIFILISIIIAKKKGVPLSVFPTRHKIFYAAATVVSMALIVSSVLIADGKHLFFISSLVSSALVVPVFEELIFRGYVWNKLEERFNGKFTVYMITTLLFAVWHIGYADSIIIRVAPDKVLFIMFMKVVTGLCFGIVLGAVRYKTKNCYSTILMHSVMNLFGR